MKRLIPLYDDSAAIACTASSAELGERREQLERLRAALASIERSEHGLMLRFPADPVIEGELTRFTVDEKACCQFWGFAVTRADDALVLQWDGPPTVGDLLDRLLAFFEDDEPLSALDGLL